MKSHILGLLLFMFVFVGCSKETPSVPAEGTVEPVTLKVGHVGHDHHLALFVACDCASEFSDTGITLKKVQDQKLYELYDGEEKIADIEIIKVGGGSKMPAALAQGIIDIGFGGVAPTLTSNDSEAPVKLIAPLHSKGDMLVVGPDLPVENWPDFVSNIKNSDKPVRIGYKSPMAVAKFIFEEALTHENLSYSGDLTNTDVHVHLINTKGGGKLNVSLGGDLIDAYVGNNPFPSIAVEQKIGRIICDLEDLPPGNFKNHPCCCIAANTDAIEKKSDAIVAMLILFHQANEIINNDLDKAVTSATQWIGTSEAVEQMSIPTSGYSLEPGTQWHQTMSLWIDALNRLDAFNGSLKNATYEQVQQQAYDLSLLKKAKERIGS